MRPAPFSSRSRGLGWVAAAVRGVLKLRYLLLGGAIGGGVSLSRQYDEWKKNLPDTEWIKDLMPDVELDKFRSGLLKASENIKGKAKEIDIDPALQATLGKLAGYRQWFEKRLDDAIQAAEAEKKAIREQDAQENNKGIDDGKRPFDFFRLIHVYFVVGFIIVSFICLFFKEKKPLSHLFPILLPFGPNCQVNLHSFKIPFSF